MTASRSHPNRLPHPIALPLVLALLFGCAALGQGADGEVTLEPAAEGLALPLGGSALPGDRFAVPQLDAVVREVVAGVALETPLLDLRSRVTALEGEQGLYAVAPHPGYETNRRLVAAFTEIGTGDLIVAEYRIVPGDPWGSVASEREIVRIPFPAPYHHGGAVAFGADGALYATVGDGLLGDEDVPSPARDLGSLRGKVLRLDIDCGAPREAPSACRSGYAVPADNPFVDTPGVLPEIFAFGFRNPWKLGFDPATGHGWIADVGVDAWEEIDLLAAGGDYGWPLWEGPRCAAAAELCAAEPGIAPIHAYRHLAADPEGGNAVVGGYVWRHPDAGRWWGTYLFADWVAGRLWALDPCTSPPRVQLLAAGFGQPSGFVRSPDGALHLTTIGGELYRLRDASGSLPEGATPNSCSSTR